MKVRKTEFQNEMRRKKKKRNEEFMSSISKGSNEQKGLINMFVIEASGKFKNGKLAEK